MYIVVGGGKVIFATHLLRCNTEGNSENLRPFQCEPEGILVYSLNPQFNLAYAENLLKKLGIPYAVEEIKHDPLHIEKAQGIKYQSRTEAIEHLLNDAEPASQVIPNLKKKLAEEKARNDKLETRLAKVELGLSTIPK